VEVAVHESVGQAALIEQPETAQQPARRGDLTGGEFAGDGAVEQRADLVGQNRCTPVRESGREVDGTVGQCGLGRDEAMDGAGDDRRRRIPAILTG